ncbi:hypothetical protein M0813_18609 [Anaeramoeba flamelloides]|uniref:Uncharacterized protein n=1 Tax=Anaeramoeba flamelloides TaxID=1746091 RepID=A0ABQ8YR36_9EUKA|nr:hypothetical protein M0813_18609 [Anaeramoeba flamelloides]
MHSNSNQTNNLQNFTALTVKKKKKKKKKKAPPPVRWLFSTQQINKNTPPEFKFIKQSLVINESKIDKSEKKKQNNNLGFSFKYQKTSQVKNSHQDPERTLQTNSKAKNNYEDKILDGLKKEEQKRTRPLSQSNQKNISFIKYLNCQKDHTANDQIFLSKKGKKYNFFETNNRSSNNKENLNL